MDYESDSLIAYRELKSASEFEGVQLLHIVLFLMLLTTMTVQPAASQSSSQETPEAPMPTWNLQTVDGPRYFTNMTDRAMAYRANGTPCAAYGGDGLYFACYNSSLGVWTTTVLDSSVGVGQYASLAFFYSSLTLTEEAFIAYYDATNGGLKLMYTLFGAWQAPENVPTPAPQYLKPETGDEPTSEAVPEDDIDFLAEVRRVQLPGLSPMDRSDPNFIIQNTLGAGKYTSIAADATGIYISYYDDRVKPDGTTMESERNLKFARWKGGTDWYFMVVDNYLDQGAVGLWSSIKVDSQSNVHIAYFSEKYDDLKYAFWDQVIHPEEPNDGWIIKTVYGEGGDQNQPNAGSMCSLDLYDAHISGVRGVPYISFLDFTESGGASDGDLMMSRLESLNSNLWTTKVIDASGLTGWWSSIVVNSNNTNPRVYISYYDPEHGDLKYATGRGVDDYSTYRAKSSVSGDGQFTSIDLNPGNGFPGILHYNAPEGRMQFTYRTSTEASNTWASQNVDFKGHDVGFNSSLVISSAGVPHISYFNTTLSALKYARAYGISWSSANILGSPNNGLYSAIDLQGDMPRIASYDSTNGNLIYGKWRPFEWPFSTVDHTHDVGLYVSMAIDTLGRSHASYYDATHGDLLYGRLDVGATHWITETRDIPGDVGKYTSLALASDNRVYISYYDEENDDLKMAYQSAPFGFWSVETVDNGGILDDEVGLFSSISLDSAERPQISYYNRTTGDLEFVSWNGASWDYTNLDSTGDVGGYTSIEVNRVDNSRHICYYDFSNGDLKYARYSTGIWEYQIVDGYGDVGASCSIDLTTAGQPAISYYDNSRADLKIAISYELPPMWLFLPVILDPGP